MARSRACVTELVHLEGSKEDTSRRVGGARALRHAYPWAWPSSSRSPPPRVWRPRTLPSLRPKRSNYCSAKPLSRASPKPRTTSGTCTPTRWCS